MGDSAIHALAGGVGGGISMALTYPLVNLSTRAAVATKKSDMTLVQAIKKTIHDEGLSGLYAGLGSSLVGIVFSNSVYYVSTTFSVSCNSCETATMRGGVRLRAPCCGALA